MRHVDQNPGGNAANVMFALTMIVLMGYLTFATLQGEHGLFRKFQIEAQQSRLEAELAELRHTHTILANKTQRLVVGQIDLELLDERARKVLGLGRTDEIIIR